MTIYSGTTKLKRREKTLLRFYCERVLNGPDRFRITLQEIAAQTGLSAKAVQRGNAQLFDLSIVSWIRGGSIGQGVPNEYRPSPEVVKAYADFKSVQSL